MPWVNFDLNLNLILMEFVRKNNVSFEAWDVFRLKTKHILLYVVVRYYSTYPRVQNTTLIFPSSMVRTLGTSDDFLILNEKRLGVNGASLQSKRVRA